MTVKPRFLLLALVVTAAAIQAEVSIGLNEGDVETPLPAGMDEGGLLLERSGAPAPGRGCRSVHSCWCDWYKRKWGDVPNDSLDPLPQEKLDAISDEYIAQCESVVSNRPRLAAAQIDLGEALTFRKRWKPARSAFAKALKIEPERPYSYSAAGCHYRMAETWFAEGDRKAATGELVRVKSLRSWAPDRYHEDWDRFARDAIVFLSGEDLNFYRMPRDTGFKPFPEPQKATYSESFAPCPTVAIRLKGVSNDDARITLLTKKLSWRGFKWNAGGVGYPLDIVLDAVAPVDKREGYALEVRKSGASIRARDLQGILWGIVSFLQVTDPAKHAVRICKVDDWPDTARRGYLGALWAGCTEFTVFNKMNCVVLQRHPMVNGWDSPLNVYQCERLAHEFQGLGLDLHYGIISWTMDMGWAYCWKKYLGMQIEIGRRFAAMGAGVYYPNDDLRYYPNVLHKEDLATGLKPSDFDAQHILDFFNGVKDKYPEFRMTYCPPFYWGPDAGHPYPDDREKYLRSLRILPDEIGIIWTGARVKSYKKEPYMAKWFTDLTGRKPYLFQNGTGPHHLLSYVVDRTDWNGWHYPGFFEKDVDCYLKNANTPTECPQITSLADCLWNVKAYDPERGIRRGMGNYAGDAFFNALDSAFRDLCYVDRYKYGQLNASVRDENVAELEAKLGRIEKATADAAAVNGQDFLDSCGAWMDAVKWFRKLVKAAKNPPDWKALNKALLERTRALADVAGFDYKRGDILLDAIDFRHSTPLAYPETLRGRPAPRDQHLVCGIRSGRYADAMFKTGSVPGEGFAEIVLRGRTDPYPGPKPESRMTVELNGRPVFEGELPFGLGEYSNKSFKVPVAAFKARAENAIKILNGKDNPQLMVAFALIKFPGGEKEMTGGLEEDQEDSLSLDE